MATDTVTPIITASPKQLAVMFGYSPDYWRKLAAEGRIPGASKLFAGRQCRWFIPLASIRTLLESGHVDAA